MSNTNNLEFGVRLALTDDKLLDKINFCNIYKLNHIQITIDNFEQLKQLDALMLENFELSVYLRFSPNTEILQLLIDEIIKKKIKFLLIPVVIYNQLDVDYLLRVTESNHFFICVDISTEDFDSQDTKQLLLYKQSEEWHFFLLALSVDTNEAKQFEMMIKKYRNSVGVINVSLNKDIVTDQFGIENLRSILETLILLPFDQQPIIFNGEDNILTLVFQSILGQQ